jgi:membrane-bound serine protease (ClpP class)
MTRSRLSALVAVFTLAGASAALSAPLSQEAGSSPDQAVPAQPRIPLGSGPIVRIPIEGVIELGLAPFVERSLREAASMGASAVILDIETPGGRVDAAERIVDAVSDSQVPVFAYVNRRAISAGAMISLAAAEIFMRPGSTLGATTPVDGAGVKASEKIVSVMRSSMRSLAEARGLDPAIAEAMVDEEIEVPGVVEAGRLLTLTYTDAEEIGYARVVEDWDALVAELGLAGREVVDQRVNWAERTVRFLSHPVVAPFLLSLGFLGLLVEIKTPGFGVAGAAGILSLSLFFGSHMIIGLAGTEGLILFGIGVILLVVELLVLPGLGIFGITGGLPCWQASTCRSWAASPWPTTSPARARCWPPPWRWSC